MQIRFSLKEKIFYLHDVQQGGKIFQEDKGSECKPWVVPFKILHGLQDPYLGLLFMYRKLPHILFINPCLEFSIILFPQCFSFYGHLLLPRFCPQGTSAVSTAEWNSHLWLKGKKLFNFLFICWARKKPPIKRRNLCLWFGSWDAAHILPTNIWIFWLWTARK